MLNEFLPVILECDPSMLHLNLSPPIPIAASETKAAVGI